MSNPDNEMFCQRTSVEQVEEGTTLAPKFDKHGLIACVTTDIASGELLMHAYMNAEALQKTIETGEARYWSRSRQQLWHRPVPVGAARDSGRSLQFAEDQKVFDPKQVYGDAPNPTQL